MIDHVVLLPSATPHRPLRLVRDVDLLLAATIASVRRNRPTSVFEPPASLAACARCLEAYAEARKVIEDAGGCESCRGPWASRRALMTMKEFWPSGATVGSVDGRERRNRASNLGWRTP